MNSESVDLIYLDPPFNSNANYAAPIGSVAAGAEFKDTWGLDDLKIAWHGLIKSEHPSLYNYLAAVKDIHSPSMMAYLIYMAVRIMEMHRLLKSSGSIYLHCDPYASHYLKVLLDNIFGKNQFRNEMVWCYTRMAAKGQKKLSQAHDIILWYSKGKKWCFNVDPIRLPYSEGSKNREGYTLNRLGSGFAKEGKTVLNPIGKFPEDWITHIPYLRGNERTGYPTQKPLALLDRIIEASSNKHDIVFDPFCGCATTCVAADALNRQWIGIDISPKAAELVEHRINDLTRKIIHRNDVPQRTDLEHIRRYNHPENKQILYGKQGGHCNACREHFESRHLEIDHIQPQSKGGTDHMDNLQLLCGSCNRIKGNRSQEYLMAVLNDKDIVKFAA